MTVKFGRKYESQTPCFMDHISSLLICLTVLLEPVQSRAVSTSPVFSYDLVQNFTGYSGRRVLYINSYNHGHKWSDGITGGIEEVFKNTGITFQIIYMDTEHNADHQANLIAGLHAKMAIERFGPDVVIVSDDNAFEYVVMPYYKNADIPIVFCGLNWNTELYEAPYKNTTGMIEVALIPQLVDYLKKYAKGTRAGFLAADTIEARKEAMYYEQLFDLSLPHIESVYVRNFSDWKEQFRLLQDQVDILILHSNSGITDWDDWEAARFTHIYTKIPTGSTFEWMAEYSLISLPRISKEQGIYAAQTTLTLLDGKAPDQIPVIFNRQSRLKLNLNIAERLGLVFSPSMLRNADIIDKEG